MNDIVFMQRALELAKDAADKGEVPVGAVVVDKGNNIIGQGQNRTITLCDPTAHAEIIALKEAALHVHNHRLIDATIYVTLEPCPMCAGALVQSRIKRLVFSCRDFNTGACGGVINIINSPASNHSVLIDEGILEKESSHLLCQFFKSKR